MKKKDGERGRRGWGRKPEEGGEGRRVSDQLPPKKRRLKKREELGLRERKRKLLERESNNKRQEGNKRTNSVDKT